jgi:type VI secretion system protein ImpI
MALYLRLENETSLPDGGPVSISVTGRRGLDIGRDQYLDWVLPDPSRFISGKHCEIRYREGQYWLMDVSTNGTFLNGSEFRVDGTQPLKSGDRIEIGRYIIAVMIEAEAGDVTEAGQPQGSGPAALWDIQQPSAPAINPQALRQPSISAGLSSLDPLDWIADIPASSPFSAPDRIPSPVAPAFASPPVDQPAPVMSVVGPASPRAAPMDWDATSAYEPPAPPLAIISRPSLPESSADRGAPQPATFDAAIRAALTIEPRITTETAAQQPEPVMPRATPMPPPAPISALPPLSPAIPPAGAASGGFRAAFARGAGVDESVIAAQSEQAFAEMLGVFVRLTTDNLRQLHMARAQSKGAMRSANMTMIQAVDNNPLRFSPTTEDALRILFGPQTTSYLSPQKALESSFHDLKKHQMAVFGAMQTALGKLIEDLDPAKIDAGLEQEKGVSSLMRSRQTRLWERYETAWKARAGTSEHGMLDVFMRLFSEAYDKNS